MREMECRMKERWKTAIYFPSLTRKVMGEGKELPPPPPILSVVNKNPLYSPIINASGGLIVFLGGWGVSCRLNEDQNVQYVYKLRGNPARNTIFSASTCPAFVGHSWPSAPKPFPAPVNGALFASIPGTSNVFHRNKSESVDEAPSRFNPLSRSPPPLT